MIINLLRYIDVVFVTCPACGHTVSLSWGWCPYHGTIEELKLEDLDGDGSFKEEFLKKYSRKTIGDLINDKPSLANMRLLVHWTEFIISR